VLRRMEGDGVRVMTAARARSVSRQGARVRMAVQTGEGPEETLVAAALLVTPAIPAKGMNNPATRTPARTLTTTNITSEYARLPMRFGVNGTAPSLREQHGCPESRTDTKS